MPICSVYIFCPLYFGSIYDFTSREGSLRRDLSALQQLGLLPWAQEFRPSSLN